MCLLIYVFGYSTESFRCKVTTHLHGGGFQNRQDQTPIRLKVFKEIKTPTGCLPSGIIYYCYIISIIAHYNINNRVTHVLPCQQG